MPHWRGGGGGSVSLDASLVRGGGGGVSLLGTSLRWVSLLRSSLVRGPGGEGEPGSASKGVSLGRGG